MLNMVLVSQVMESEIRKAEERIYKQIKAQEYMYMQDNHGPDDFLSWMTKNIDDHGITVILESAAAIFIKKRILDKLKNEHVNEVNPTLHS